MGSLRLGASTAAALAKLLKLLIFILLKKSSHRELCNLLDFCHLGRGVGGSEVLRCNLGLLLISPVCDYTTPGLFRTYPDKKQSTLLMLILLLLHYFIHTFLPSQTQIFSWTTVANTLFSQMYTRSRYDSNLASSFTNNHHIVIYRVFGLASSFTNSHHIVIYRVFGLSGSPTRSKIHSRQYFSIKHLNLQCSIS